MNSNIQYITKNMNSNIQYITKNYGELITNEKPATITIIVGVENVLRDIENKNRWSMFEFD